MVAILTKFSTSIDSMNEKIGLAVSWLTTAMVLIVCLDVVTRYFFKSSSVAIQELQWHLFSIVFLLAAAYTLKHDRHVRVDVFYHSMTDKNRARVDFIGHLFFLIPFCMLIIWSSKDFVVNSFMINETSGDPGGLPFRYILKGCIPLGFFLVMLQSLSQAIKSYLKIRGEK